MPFRETRDIRQNSKTSKKEVRGKIVNNDYGRHYTTTDRDSLQQETIAKYYLQDKSGNIEFKESESKAKPFSGKEEFNISDWLVDCVSGEDTSPPASSSTTTEHHTSGSTFHSDSQQEVDKGITQKPKRLRTSEIIEDHQIGRKKETKQFLSNLTHQEHTERFDRFLKDHSSSNLPEKAREQEIAQVSQERRRLRDTIDKYLKDATHGYLPYMIEAANLGERRADLVLEGYNLGEAIHTLKLESSNENEKFIITGLESIIKETWQKIYDDTNIKSLDTYIKDLKKLSLSEELTNRIENFYIQAKFIKISLKSYFDKMTESGIEDHLTQFQADIEANNKECDEYLLVEENEKILKLPAGKNIENFMYNRTLDNRTYLRITDNNIKHKYDYLREESINIPDTINIDELANRIGLEIPSGYSTASLYQFEENLPYSDQ